MAVLNKNETGATSLEGGDPSIGEKPTAIPLEDSEDLQALAARGHVATDQYVSLASPKLLPIAASALAKA